jgi:hypothetical protein
MFSQTGRWPALVDASSMKQIIGDLLRDEAELEARFYQSGELDESPCQGDILELRCAAPFIDEEGQPVATDNEFQHWLVIGNTCDMARPEEPRSLIAPLVPVTADLAPAQLRVLRRYEYYKQFYVPPWQSDPEQLHRLADFMQLVTIEKAAFQKAGSIVARMQLPAWALLHACIVRYLARDDGRFD